MSATDIEDTATSTERVPSSAGAGFRPDIDGLRALAIVVIVLYHADIPGFPGGYVGVDVFFVISGYLITRNLLSERDRTDRIGLWAFWGRRARRLAPALALMTVATFGAALLILSPLEWKEVTAGGVTSTLYISNLYFAHQATDYFAAGAVNPFLHTWSLSVEEQFYVFWPILVAVVLAAAARAASVSRRAIAVALGVVVVGSFGLCVVLTERGTPWAFFSLPTRAWQFAAAGLLASLTPRRVRSRAVDLALGWFGLALVAYSVVAFDDLTTYPGTAAAIPTVGTLLLIASGGHDRRPILDDCLTAAPVQAIGRVSYSWYLWHWPVIVLAIAATESTGLGVRLGAVVLGLALGAASYRFLEAPVRFHPRLRRSPAASLVVAGAFAAIALVAAAGLTVAYRHQMSRPFYAALRDARADQAHATDCREPGPHPETCTIGPDDAERTIVVIGDSHAGVWIPALAEAVSGQSIQVVIRSRGACPSVDVRIAKTGTREDSIACAQYRVATEDLLEQVRPDLVVLANAAYPDRVLTGSGTVGTDEAQVAAWKDAFGRQVEALEESGTRVAVIENGPQLDFDPLSCIARNGGVEDCTPTRSDAMRASTPFRQAEREALEELAGTTPTFDAAALLCDDRVCRLQDDDGTYTLVDADHVSATFSTKQSATMEAFLNRALDQPTR